MLECLRMIREEEPPKPSTRLSTAEQLPSVAANRGLEPKKLSGLVRGDLDWIVMKCLEKDRNRRYETANGLALDVQRYLADEPVLASPPSAVYRLRKFARRHKAGLADDGGGTLGRAAGWQRRRLGRCGTEPPKPRRGAGNWPGAWRRRNRRSSLRWPRRSSRSVQAAGHAAGVEQGRGRSAGGLAAGVETRWAEAEAALRTGAADDALGSRSSNCAAGLREADDRWNNGTTQTLRQEKLFRDLDDARMARYLEEGNTFRLCRCGGEIRGGVRGFRTRSAAGTDRRCWHSGFASEEPAVRDALIVALDDWAVSRAGRPPWRQTCWRLAQAADHDAWRQDYRRAAVERDATALVRLSGEVRSVQLPPASLQLLAYGLEKNERREEALAVLRWGRGLYPADFWIAFPLGRLPANERRLFPWTWKRRSAVSAWRWPYGPTPAPPTTTSAVPCKQESVWTTPSPNSTRPSISNPNSHRPTSTSALP